MTLKRKDGTWSMARIGTVATVIISMPIAIGYCKVLISPWTSLPDKIDSMQKDISRIERHLEIQDMARDFYTTNKPMATK